MIDLEHCLILGREPIDSNSLNRCIFNIYSKMGEFNSGFINATSENVPQSPFFSGGYENALTDIPYVTALGTEAVSSNSERHGLVERLYSGAVDLEKLYITDSLVTESVTGNYFYSSDDIKRFAPTVDSIVREKSPLLLRSFVDEESSMASDTNTLNTGLSPTVKYTSYMLSGKTGISFGTITFSRNNGDTQLNEISLDIKSSLIGINGVDRIKFFTIGNGYASGVRTVSENLDMVTDVGPCSITYQSDTDIVISNITKNDDGDSIIIDKETGRILESDEEYDYSKCTVLSNNDVVLDFFIIFELKDNVLEYSDDLWCFNVVNSKLKGRSLYYDSTGYAEGYSKYSFENFEAADCGMEPDIHTHVVFPTDDEEIGGCTTIADDAFRNCYKATFESLCWFSPRLRSANNMFLNCKNAVFTSVPSEFDFSRIHAARNMFANCYNAEFNTIESINLSSASRITGMFSGCAKAQFSRLKDLNINGDASSMFNGDDSATFKSLSAIHGRATSMESMFEDCPNASFSSLKTINSNRDGENVTINAKRMFYSLELPKFNGITDIDIKSASGYDGTEMFYECMNADFINLTSIGDVRDGTRMFMNLDNLRENEDKEKSKGHATFSKLHSLGNHLENGTEMFRNDDYLDMVLTDDDNSVVYGDSMFMNTSSIVINGSLSKLNSATYMFSHTNTAVVKGNIDSLQNGEYMFFDCGSADVSGTVDSLKNMNNMCLSSDIVHFLEVPSTAMYMDSTFACITGSCYISSWEPSVENRSCLNTFQNSRNIWINGNIIDGAVKYTSNMFYNAGNNGSYIVLNNPSMTATDDYKHRYYSSNSETNYGIFQNFSEDYSEYSETLGSHFTFIGSVESTNDSISSYAASSDAVGSLLCFQRSENGGNSYDIFSTNDSVSASDIEDAIRIYSREVEFGTVDTVDIYTLDGDGNNKDKYGTLVRNIGTDSAVISFYREGSLSASFESEIVGPKVYMGEDDDRPTVQTFTVVDSVAMESGWTDATNMMYNVMQDSLLSGYDCFVSDSLVTTDGMFYIDENNENDRTFANAGNLFRKMPRSSITSMDSMFENRYVCDASVFTDNYIDDDSSRLSFCIPLKVVDANGAYRNTTFVSDSNYVYLDIPETLTGAIGMFYDYSGPRIRLNYDNDEWITLNDNISTSGMFHNCSFWNNGNQKYRISTPSIYLQMFNDSDFNMNCVTDFEFRNGKTIAYPYEEGVDYFFNDDKMMGCSSVTFSSLQNDITEWFNSDATTVKSAVNVEGVYLATLVGPKNVYTETDGVKYYSKNYEMMTADIIGKSGGEYDYSIRMSSLSSLSGNIPSELVNATSGVYMDSVTAFDDSENRLTCMFCPSAMFAFSTTVLGDGLWNLEVNSEYAAVDNTTRSGIGRTLYNGLYNSSGNQLNYRNVTLDAIQKVNARELSLTFAGLEKAHFNNLTTIGDGILNGYGAFMHCTNAGFDILSSITVMQTDSEDTFSSRFASSDEQKSAWFGNYNNMFYGDSSATLSSLEMIAFNGVNGKDSDGRPVMLWIDADDYVCYYYEKYDKRTEKTYKYIYQIKILTYTLGGKSYYRLEVHDISGDSISANGLSFSYNTSVHVHKNVEFNYELCELNGNKTVIITILDENNRNNYFVANSKNGIKYYSMHPSAGFADYTSDNFTITPFLSAIGGETYHTEESFLFTGRNFTLNTSDNDESEFYTLNLTDIDSGTVMRLGSKYTNDDYSTDYVKVDEKNMYFSRLIYSSGGINYMAITIFDSDKKPSSTEISYPENAVCYRVYTYDGNTYVDEMTVIPGTLEYSYLISMSDTNGVALSHKAFCSGMFKGCSKSRFESLNTICIPMTGSCAEMFSGCTSADFTGNNRFNMLILPVSWQYDKVYEYDHENYKQMFKGLSTEQLKLDSLTLDTTNIYKLGKQISNSESTSGHHLIGEQLFDGMVLSGIASKTFNLSGNPSNPFLYQNAIYDLHMDCDMAKLMFDRGKTHNVKVFDVYGNVELDVDVEYETWDKLWKEPTGTITKTGYHVRIPEINHYGLVLQGWRVQVQSSGETVAAIDSSAISYGPIEDDYYIYPVYNQTHDQNISAHTAMMNMSSIEYHNGDDEKDIVTSLRNNR